MDPNLVVAIIALLVGAVAVGIAIWQGRLSKQQLDLARDTERRTEETLTEIRRSTEETRRIVQDVKDNIDARITKIIDSRIAVDEQSSANSSAISQMLMQKLMEGISNPDSGKS